MKAKKIIASILAVAVLCCTLAACGKKDKTDTTNPNGSGVSDTASGKADYAIILKTLSNDFWAKMKTGIEEEAKKLGVKVDIFAAQNEEDTAGQLTILENCLTKSYKAIGVAPLSPTNLINGIVQANEKGIYVMNIDEKVDVDTLRNAGGSVIAFATTDNEAVGEKGAKFIINQLGEDGGDVAIIEGKAGNASGESRKNGATKAFKAADDIDLVASQPADWDRQKALDTATSYIQMYPDLRAIYCCNDTMALGALQAVINADKLGKIIVVGTDGSAEALESIRAGQLDATVAQDPAEIGATSLRKMVEAAKDKPKFDPNAEPQMIPVDSNIVTKENIK
ncbi:MAG: D-allose transporter substrate-binding protein [Clostridia bacterium]|nr:D-allose transporter substrate-binding protein [Clostridia bacterium]